jgi:hypothetical protein
LAPARMIDKIIPRNMALRVISGGCGLVISGSYFAIFDNLKGEGRKKIIMFPNKIFYFSQFVKKNRGGFLKPVHLFLFFFKQKKYVIL